MLTITISEFLHSYELLKISKFLMQFFAFVRNRGLCLSVGDFVVFPLNAFKVPEEIRVKAGLLYP